MILKASLVGAAAVVAASLAPLPAHAQDPLCGSVLTESLVLQQDLFCPSGDGLVAGANGITIDLNGFTVAMGHQGVGVAVQSVENVTVKNGSIYRAELGLLVSSAPAVKVLDVETPWAHSAIRVSDSHDALVRDSMFDGMNTLDVRDSDRGAFLRNVFPGNTNSGFTFLRVNDAEISENFVTTSNGSNIYVQGDNNRVTLNTSLSGMSSNIDVRGDNNVVRGNITSHGTGDSIVVRGNRNKVQHNQSARSDNGIRVFGTQNMIIGNAVTDNVGPAGILVDDPQATVSENRAHRNSGLGIHALHPVPGGGNSATENGDPRQCVNVRCLSLTAPASGR